MDKIYQSQLRHYEQKENQRNTEILSGAFFILGGFAAWLILLSIVVLHENNLI